MSQVSGAYLKMSIAQLVVYGAVFAYPSLTLTVRGGVNGAMAIISLAAILLLILSGKKPREHFSDPESQLFMVAMISGAAAILINQIYYQHFDLRPFDSELRFILAVPIFLALRGMKKNLATVLEIAIPIGVLVTVFFLVAWHGHYARLQTNFLDAIHVGEVVMLLGFISLLSINWLRSDSRYMLLIKLSAFIASMYVVVRTGSRGVWLVVPILLLFGYATQSWRPVSIKRALIVVAGICVAAYLSIGGVQQRVDLTYSNLESYLTGKVNNGTAARIELWVVAIRLLEKHPVAGIQQGSLPEMLQQMHGKGEINDLVREEGMAEMHSEIAARMAKYGTFGLLAALITIAIPFWLFLRAMKSDSRMERGAARMGVALMLSLFVFGLTVEIFNIKMVVAFFALTIAVLMALSIPIRQYGSDLENE